MVRGRLRGGAHGPEVGFTDLAGTGAPDRGSPGNPGRADAGRGCRGCRGRRAGGAAAGAWHGIGRRCRAAAAARLAADVAVASSGSELGGRCPAGAAVAAG
ncbi:MAG: hypothetical protein ACK5PF_00715 [bacterium]